MNRAIPSLLTAGCVLLALAGSAHPAAVSPEEVSNAEVSSVLDNVISIEESYMMQVRVDSTLNDSLRYTGLTEEDFQLVADELDVEVAAIRAVVEVEAGKAMKGFWAPGVPVINFDSKMFAQMKSKATSKEGAKGETVPEGLSGYAHREWTQLINARKTNAQAANMGTFWGMFQIGGFNYRQCGCSSVDEFVRLMAYSELEQLELFAAFITNSGMLQDLRQKNWSAFARKYNGAGYKKRGYHTKMAAAYKKYSSHTPTLPTEEGAKR